MTIDSEDAVYIVVIEDGTQMTVVHRTSDVQESTEISDTVLKDARTKGDVVIYQECMRRPRPKTQGI